MRRIIMHSTLAAPLALMLALAGSDSSVNPRVSTLGSSCQRIVQPRS